MTRLCVLGPITWSSPMYPINALRDDHEQYTQAY